MTVNSIVNPKPARHFKQRLANTILLVLLPLALLPVLLLGAGAYYRSYTFLRSQIISQLTTAVEGQANQITTRMQTKDKFLSTLITDPNFAIPLNTALRIPHASPAFSGVRDQLIFDFNSLRGTESEPSFSQFFIVNSDKVVVVASNPNWEGLNISGSQLEDMLGQTTSKAIYNSAPIYQNQFTVFNAQPYIDAQGVTIATIYGIADATATRRDLAGSAVVNPAANAYLLTSDGFVVGLDAAKTALTIAEQTTDQKSYLLSLAAGPAQGKAQSIQSSSNQPLFGYSKYLPALQAGFIVELPQTTVFSPLTAILPFLGLLALASLVFLGVVVWLGTSRLVKPLVYLSDVTTRFAEGEWHQRANINRTDEIGLLANSFNQMANELTALYRSLESRVEERTKQVRAASEAAQIVSSAPTMRELLRRIVGLIVDRFGYFDASVYLIDDTGVFAVLTETGQTASALKRGRDYRLAVGANSIIGWVTGHNQSRITGDSNEDPLNLKNELLPETHSEAVFPISVGDYIIGALDVQSIDRDAFSPEDIDILQTVANQIAISIQNIRLFESTKINLAEASLLYQTSRLISQAETEGQIFDIIETSLAKTSFVTGIFKLEHDRLAVISISDPLFEGSPIFPDHLLVNPNEINNLLPPDRPYILAEIQRSTVLPGVLRDFFSKYKCQTIAILPVKVNGSLMSVLVLGSSERGGLTSTSVQPYANLAELISTALEKVRAQQNMQQRLNDLQILNSVSETISTKTELFPIYQDIHAAVDRALGTVNFLVALYDVQKNTIQIPYMVEDQKLGSVDPLPLGDGLTSIVIRNRQPLLLSDLSEAKLNELGARASGKTLKSWLGIPMMVGGEVIGALVVQDPEKPNRFTETDLHLLTTLSGQVAGSIRNVLLLNQTRQYAERERTLHEVTSHIRNSASIQSILETTAVELGRALGARKASIQVGTGVTAADEFVEKKPQPGNDGDQEGMNQ